MITSLRCTAGAWATISVVACAVAKEPAPAGSSPPDTVSRTAAAMTPIAPDTQPLAATPGLDTVAQVGIRGGHARRDTGEAHLPGGPLRSPIPPRSSGCGGTFVVVTLKPSAVTGSGDATAALRAASSEVLAPVRDQVGALSLSPSVHAFRVSVKDPAGANRIVARLRTSPKVESATVDDCAVRIERD